jgi:uncharacterized membrane protein
MRQGRWIACWAVLGVVLLSQRSEAQGYYYPSGYGGYGWGGWGADPGAGYMAGLGAYAQGQGIYEVQDAQAQSINLDTMIKWNKALRDRQRELREDQRKESAERREAQAARVDRADLLNGYSLNDVLARIYEFDPSAGKSSRAMTALGSSAIRDIPFHWDTEAITICLDQMTGRDALPSALLDARFLEERTAVRAAVEAALKEDANGDVSLRTQKRLQTAIANFRAKFVKDVPDFELGYADSDAYLTTLAGLVPLLHDPSMKKILAELNDDSERSVGDLIAFMHSYNLRFGPAITERQVQIYERLLPMLQRVLDDVDNAPPPAREPGNGGKNLRSAAQDAFKGMNWGQLKAQQRNR